MKTQLGTCYYPEHWSQDIWKEDASRMAKLGLSLVRIGEFSWSKLEPEQGSFDWSWLDKAIDVLADAGLQVVLGTPSATPPRWMIDLYPDMLAIDANGHERRFGSRRHYCFSHQGFREHAAAMAGRMAERYADHAAVHSWQLDNEYGCHDTIVSYSDAARVAFRDWLKEKYESIELLNKAWGNVFWSMEYGDFSDVNLPNLTVTEPNPAHVLDFRRFSSDQVVVFNKTQANAVRAHCSKPLIHNYMGRITEFDHYKVGDDLEIASWDSYPLGFLVDRSGTSEEWQKRFERQGDPDLQAMHHDLYREVGRGRWWVMEQQPGPVNWAPYNPAPLPGMVRLWTWEAIAHQAEAVCYFRWRQAPFAQEQMHAGLLRPDSKESATFGEVVQVESEIQEVGDIEFKNADVAIVFDYESCWAWETQPQGHGFDAFAIVFDFYRALRRLGITVDLIRPDRDSLGDYKLVFAPGLFTINARLKKAMDHFEGTLVLGPRTNSRDENFHIPLPLPPALSTLSCEVDYVETFPKSSCRPISKGGNVHTWLETLNTDEEILETVDDEKPLLVRNGSHLYLAGWPDDDGLLRILRNLSEGCGIEVVSMPEGVRRRCSASHEFVFNHNDFAVDFQGHVLEPAAVKIRPLSSE